MYVAVAVVVAVVVAVSAAAALGCAFMSLTTAFVAAGSVDTLINTAFFAPASRVEVCAETPCP